MTETTTILGRPDAALPLAGTERVPMDQAGAVVTAGSFVSGQTYRIVSIGSTNFIAIGAAANTVGLYFVATGIGSGNGTAAIMTTVDASTQDIASLTSANYAPIAHVGSSGTAHAVATTTVAGFLSAADKAKLDAITTDSGTVLLKYVRNDTVSSIAKGTPVYITGSSGTTLTIAPSDATDETRSARTIGVTQAAIGSNSNGYIVCVGLLDGINTAALTEGQLIWLSETTGQFTSTQPVQPAHGVICGYCVKQGSGTSGILYIKIDNGYELNELHNVLISSAATDQALVLASDGLWKNRTVYSSTTPAALGTAAVGTGTTLARADHVHQLPSTAALGAVSAVTGTAPIASSGGLTPAISISAATTGADGSMSSSDKTKLDGITSGATANSSDAQLRDRSTHTGTQAVGTITGLGSLATQSATLPTGAIVGTTDTQTLTAKTLGNLRETTYTITDGAAFEIDPANGPIQTVTLGANRSPAATNFASGQSVKLKIDDGTAYAITWATVGVVWIGQTAGSSGTAPTLGTTGWTHIELWKEGSIIYGALIGYSAT